MTTENKMSLKGLDFAENWRFIKALFFDDIDDDEWEFDYEDCEEEYSQEEQLRKSFILNRNSKINLTEEYDRMACYVLGEEYESFPMINEFFDRLSRYICVDEKGKYYTTEHYVEKLLELKGLVEKVYKEEPGYLSSEFVEYLDFLLDKKERDEFKFLVVKTARKFLHVE